MAEFGGGNVRNLGLNLASPSSLGDLDAMPLVISHASNEVCYVQCENELAEILGHSNFDGEDWAIGDTVLFEDGTTATIKLLEDDEFYVWTDNEPIELSDAIEQSVRYRAEARDPLSSVDDWEGFFGYFQEKPRIQPDQSGWKCLVSVAFLAVFLVFSYAIWSKFGRSQW